MNVIPQENGRFDLEISESELLLAARAQEITALLALPHFVENGLVTQSEADEISKLCHESISVIDQELAKLPI